MKLQHSSASKCRGQTTYTLKDLSNMEASQQQVFNYVQQTMGTAATLSAVAAYQTLGIISPAASPISLQQKIAKPRKSGRSGNRKLQGAKGQAKALRSKPSTMRQAKSALKPPTLPKIPLAATVVPKLLETIKYHPNKARQFAPKQRTAQEQLRRERNTRACLLSRQKKRAEELLVAHTYEEQTAELQQSFVEMWRMELYLNCLNQVMVTRSMAAISDTPIDLSMGRHNY